MTRGARLGLRKNRIYNTWRGMKSRCSYPADKSYKWYGAKGIKYDPSWEIFANFVRDMGVPPEEGGWTLERIDTTKNYSAENCMWLHYSAQMKNMGRNHKVNYKGKEIILTAWARATGMHVCTYYDRLKAGWTEEEAVNTPRRGKR